MGINITVLFLRNMPIRKLKRRIVIKIGEKIKMLADILHKIAAMESDEDKPYFPRPSLAGPERCIRQMVYWGLGLPKEPLSGRAIMIFDDSSWHEELTADWIRKTAFHLHSEQMHVNIPTNLSFLPKRTCKAIINGHECGKLIPIRNLAAHVDGILTDINQVDYLWEHKGINHFTFQKYWGGELPLDYITQCCLYLKGLSLLNPNLNTANLLLKNKNTSQYLEFMIRYQGDSALIYERTNSLGEKIVMDVVIEHITEDAIKKFANVQDYINQKKLPKRQYDIDHWRCSYCQYNKTCWEDYEKEFKELKTDTMLPDEVADMVRYKREVSAHRLEMEKEEKELTEKIKATMKEAGVRQGKAGEYLCTLSLVTRKSIDQSLLPKKIREEATKVSQYEKLNIRKVKGAQ
jgi:hypothetical protein